MTQISTLHYEAQVDLNRKKIKLVYTIFAGLFLVSIGAIVWATMNWEEYTYYVQDVITGEISLTGPASHAYYWGIGFAIAVPVIGGLNWMSLDFKNPALAVNKDGIFINREGFKKTFLKWDEFEKIEKITGDELRLHMKNPEEVVSRQPGFRKPFLKQTYVKERSPYVIASNDGDINGGRAIIDAVIRYSGLVQK